MFEVLVESFMSGWSVGTVLSCMLMALSGYLLIETFAKPPTERLGDTRLLFFGMSMFAFLFGCLLILSAFNEANKMSAPWRLAYEFSTAALDTALAHAKTRLAWSVATFALATFGAMANNWAKRPLLGWMASAASTARAAVTDRLRLRNTLRALRGIEWNETRRNIRTVAVEFLPELRARRTELRKQIERLNRRLKGPGERIGTMNEAVRGMYDQACGVLDQHDANLRSVDAKIQDCEDFVDLAATLAETSPTELSNVTVRFDQLADAVIKTRAIVDRTSAEVEGSNVRPFPSRQKT